MVTRTSSCVNVNWVKEDTGLCLLNYTVALKNENAEILYEKFGIGVTEISQCDIPPHHNITSVSVTVQMADSNSTVSKAVSAPMSGILLVVVQSSSSPINCHNPMRSFCSPHCDHTSFSQLIMGTSICKVCFSLDYD